MIYLDAGIVMRLVEGGSNVRLPIEARLGTILGAQRILVTSRLSRLECMCKPLREKRNDTLAAFMKDSFLRRKFAFMRLIRQLSRLRLCFAQQSV